MERDCIYVGCENKARDFPICLYHQNWKNTIAERLDALKSNPTTTVKKTERTYIIPQRQPLDNIPETTPVVKVKKSKVFSDGTTVRHY